jgi:hypothetical protein
MALVSCPECGTEVSESALDCPKCGKRLRKPKRGLFGNIVKYSFIGFNILMAIWLFGGISSAAGNINQLEGAEQAGAAIGTGIGAILIISIWVFGDIFLGLFTLLTRPSR